MATTQFDRIYHGLSPEVGSEYNPFSTVSRLMTMPRVASCDQWHGLEGRGKRSSESHTRRRDQVGPMVSRREKLSTQSRAQGQAEGNV